jgi:hypothetical protein
MLHFHLSSVKARKQARAKVDRLAKVINEFRKHVIKELEAIDNAETTIALHRKNKASRAKTSRRS